MQNLFTNGCSYNQWRTVAPHNVQTCVGQEIAKHYNLDLTNMSAGGKGNDRIVTTTMNWFLQNSSRMKNSFALIQWSSAARFDYPRTNIKKEDIFEGFDLQWRSINVLKDGKHGKETFEHFTKMDLPAWLQQKYFSCVINLQNFFKIHNIPYLMYNGLENDLDTDAKEFVAFKEYVLKKRFFKFDDSRWVHRNFCVSRNMELHNDGHASEIGVKKYAKLLQRYIDSEQLMEKHPL